MTSMNATSDILDIYIIRGSFTERFFMGLWSAATSAMALTGNMTVLVASLKYNAIKLDKISTILIKNIALADMGFSFYIMSTFVTIVTDEWVFGDLMCYITNYWHMFFGISEIYLICAFNISKLHCLIFPLQARVRSPNTGRLVALAMWSVMPLFYLIPAILMGRVVTFRHSYYRCEGYFEDPEIKFPFFASVFFILLPMIVVCIAIVWLLFYIRGVTGLQKQSVLTLLLISSCYFGSYLPYGIYHIIKATLPNVESNIAISIHLYRFALFMLYLNFSINPLIYVFSVKSFKEFLVNFWNLVTNKTIPFSENNSKARSKSDRNLSPKITQSANTTVNFTSVMREI